MADAPVLGTGTRKGMEVQVLSPAPFDSALRASLMVLVPQRGTRATLPRRMTLSEAGAESKGPLIYNKSSTILGDLHTQYTSYSTSLIVSPSSSICFSGIGDGAPSIRSLAF